MVRAILSVRFLLLLAAVGAILGGAMMFWLAFVKLAHSAAVLWTSGADAAGDVTAAVMRATDAFLFGVVLVIFAYAIAFGFAIQLPRHVRERLPTWMQVTGVDVLEQTLVDVILGYLVVDFATDIENPETPTDWTTLVKPVSILVIAAARYLMGKSHRSPPAEMRSGSA
ncbi:YqhA family protein [Methylobacterium nigriterrae]|uniref:YqhA family protein n=1 Tax=Methylobacterium nigriterrae TaxID=3127512 RepID=UPI003013F948